MINIKLFNSEAANLISEQFNKRIDDLQKQGKMLTSSELAKASAFLFELHKIGRDLANSVADLPHQTQAISFAVSAIECIEEAVRTTDQLLISIMSATIEK